MIGDRLVITEYHRQGAALVWEALRERREDGYTAVTIAGESGSGKSEIAQCLADLLSESDIGNMVFGQDDYFRLPPRSNHERRLTDLEWVGPGEVQLELLDSHIRAIKNGAGADLEKPLVYFDENRIGSEVVQPPPPPAVVIAEGTYTTMLEHADLRVFINRTYDQNRAARLKRARDPDPEFLESVLAIEHEIISRHRERADVVIPPPDDEAN